MAYTKRTWSCGDKITADALNHIEQGVEDAQDKGYECSATTSLILNETFTAQGEGTLYDATLAYTGLIKDRWIKVTYDGVEYILERRGTSNTRYEYGADFDATTNPFDDYPFVMNSYVNGTYNEIYTSTAGTHSIKVEKYDISATSDVCFSAAVGAEIDKRGQVIVAASTVTFTPRAAEFYPLNSTTVGANASQTLTLSPPSYVDIDTERAAINKIALPPGLAICGIGFGYTDSIVIYLTVYNVTNNAIVVSNDNNTSVKVLCFNVSNETYCVVRADCEDGGPK